MRSLKKRMKNLKKSNLALIFGFLFLFLLLPNVSSAGLKIVNGSIFSVNKTYGSSENIKFQLHNPKNFAFHNVSFEDNDYIRMNKIEKINPGEKINVTAEVITDEDLNSEEIRIKGVYESEVGTSNETHLIDILSLEEGLNPCDKSIYKGDTIKWINNIDDVVTLRDSKGDKIAEINKNKTYSKELTQVVEFSYNARIPIYGVLGNGQSCTIKAMDTQGYINNPDYDSIITLSTTVNYIDTNISVQQFEDTYNISYDSTQEGVITIKNIGDDIAKNINIKSEWLSFSPNNFDLEPGISKNVQYKIKPVVFDSNETGKLYKKNVTITGNFPKKIIDFNIFVQYAPIVKNGDSKDKSFNEILSEYLSILESYCKDTDNREEQVCKDFEQKIIYQGGNGSGVFNVTHSIEQVRENQKAQYEIYKENKEQNKWERKILQQAMNLINQTKNSSDRTYEEAKSIDNKFQDTNETWIFLTGFVSTLIIAIGGYFLYKELKDRRFFKKIETF